MSVPPDGGPPSVVEPRDAPQPQADAGEDADVHAFLIADVRGYTAFTQEHGDEGAGRLAGRFAEVARAVVEDHRGRVVELRGDEALVVFGSPRSAIRGAVALQQRFVEETIADPSLPLTVGVGLDAGEAVPVEGGYRGGALNVAARLCSMARAGEVLASREIVHLARRVDGVRFTERGQAELKGLDGPVHVVAVRSEDRDDAQAIAPFVRSTAPTPRKRWKAVAAAIALVVVAALVTVPIMGRNEGSSEIEPNSLGVLDPKTGELTATVGLKNRPGSVAASVGAVWVTNPDVGTVMRLDPIEQAAVDTIQVGEDPTAIAADKNAVWVVQSGAASIARISPDTNEVVSTIPVGNGPVDVAVGEGGVWVTNRFDGTLARVDPLRGRVVETIPVGFDPRGVEVGFGSIWVALPSSNTVVRVDPETNSVTQMISVGNGPETLVRAKDTLWVANTLDDTVASIDPEDGHVSSVHEVGDGPSDLAIVGETLWTANEGDGTISTVASGGPSGRLRINSIPQGLVPVGDAVWVSVSEAATSHRGGTLRIVLYQAPDTLDPATAYDYFAWKVLPLIGDGLVGFKAVGGIDGQTIVPDLATSRPEPTDGGRTYLFQLREGIRYSNGDAVRASDFRDAIQRVFGLESGGADLFTGLVGAEACTRRPRTCDLSKGIVANDSSNTITFNLTKPDPDFLYKLALPFAHPVPRSVPDVEQPAAGVPGTGPYMLEAPQSETELVLVRNPYFDTWSKAAQPDGNVNRMQWSFQSSGSIEEVSSGRADIALEMSSSQLEQSLVRAPGQVRTSLPAQVVYAELHTEIPPFDDVNVRRAVNYALDRARVVEILGGDVAARATCQQIPPNFPGYRAYCPYRADTEARDETWTAPDLDTARKLIRRSGTEGMEVTYSFDPEQYGCCEEALASYMVEMLESLGYEASANPVHTYDQQFQMVFVFWGSDYPSPANFIVPLVTCGAALNTSGFCDPRIDALVERATRVQARDPLAATRLWAEIDRAVVDRAPYLWLANPVAADFVSPALGNYQRHPQWGVLLSQLWLR